MLILLFAYVTCLASLFGSLYLLLFTPHNPSIDVLFAVIKVPRGDYDYTGLYLIIANILLVGTLLCLLRKIKKVNLLMVVYIAGLFSFLSHAYILNVLYCTSIMCGVGFMALLVFILPTVAIVSIFTIFMAEYLRKRLVTKQRG